MEIFKDLLDGHKFKITKKENKFYYFFPKNINDPIGMTIDKVIYTFTFLKEKGAFLEYSIFLKHHKEIAEKLSNNDKICFYYDVINFMSQTKIFFTDEPTLFNEVIYNAWEIAKKSDIYNDYIIKQYLSLCTNDENQDWFDLHPDNLNREKEVEKIANFIKKNMADFSEQDKEKAKILLRDARTWLMKRYDIDKAAEIQFGKKSIKYILAKCLPEAIAILTLLSLFFIKIDFWNHFELPPLKVLNLEISNYALFAGYLAVFYFSGYIIKKIEAGYNQFQILLPRIVGGIVVGYFALMTDEAFGGVFSKFVSFTINDKDKFSWLIFAGKIFIPLLFVYIYLLIEMSNVKGIDKIQTKALRILGRGYSYSLIIGVIFSDIFGRNLFNRIFENKSFLGVYYRGILGNIYPEMVLLLSPLALFIGIFLQLLWEDKAVTEKI